MTEGQKKSEQDTAKPPGLVFRARRLVSCGMESDVLSMAAGFVCLMPRTRASEGEPVQRLAAWGTGQD